MNGHLSVYKRPLPAHWIRFRIPEQAAAVMGHTRMTTQGSEYRNYNNHPFSGKAASRLRWRITASLRMTDFCADRKSCPFPKSKRTALSLCSFWSRRQHRLSDASHCFGAISRFLHLYGSGWRRAALYRAREQSVLPVPLAGTGAVSLRLHAGGAGCGCVQDPEAAFRKYAEYSG